MVCKNCEKNPVIKLTNNDVELCKLCFFKYFEKKVRRTISKYKLIEPKDHIIVAVSGGKDSMALLYVLNKLKKNIKITGMLLDEGIKDYRDGLRKNVIKYCKENKIPLKIYYFKKEFGKALDKMVPKGEKACNVCGVLRRYLLNKYARKLKATKLATGHNLDDECQSALMNQFRRNIKTSARLGPITGVQEDKRFIKRIKPLYFLLDEEALIYASLKDLPFRSFKYCACPYAVHSYRNSIKKMLNEFEEKYPGTKNNIINSFLEILPLLKKKYTGEIKSCRSCGEPCSGEICQTCNLVKKLKLK